MVLDSGVVMDRNKNKLDVSRGGIRDLRGEMGTSSTLSGQAVYSPGGSTENSLFKGPDVELSVFHEGKTSVSRASWDAGE